MSRDWFDGIGLSRMTVSELKRRGLYDPMDLVCVRPRELYVRGVSDADMAVMYTYVATHCTRELVAHELNTSRDRPRVFLERMGWSTLAIRDACNEIDERRGVHVPVTMLASEHEGAVRRMMARSSARRHHHGESRKHFISR